MPMKELVMTMALWDEFKKGVRCISKNEIKMEIVSSLILRM